MAKNVFFSEETLNNVEQLVTTENGQAIIDYGKGNFILGGATAAAFAAFGWVVYEAGKLAVSVVKYLKA